MEFHITGNAPYIGQYIAAPDPPPNAPNRLNDQALMALPFIGLFVGVDGSLPTKAIYVLYDPENAGLAYVHGDGTFVIPSHICFTRFFKDPSMPLYKSQRVHLIELMGRSAVHYHKTNSRNDYPNETIVKFTTASSIKASLTYISDLQPNSCPALSGFDLKQNRDTLLDQAVPHMPLGSNLDWNFDASGFQAVAPRDNHEIDGKYVAFKSKYRSVQINVLDFHHAAFCLAGLVKAGFIHFLYEGQNDPRYFIKGRTPPLKPRLVKPLRTTKGWTVDCFIARFEKFQAVFNKSDYVRIPNPVLWLEAEMDNEVRSRKIKQPWKIEVDKRDESILSWELLNSMAFETRGDSKEYPKPCTSKAAGALGLGDIVSERTGKVRESKRATKEREERDEREEAEKRAARPSGRDSDLTDDSLPAFGHVNDGMLRQQLNNHRCYSFNKSEVLSPAAGQKRKHGQDPSSHLFPIVEFSDSDEPKFKQQKTTRDKARVEVYVEDVNRDIYDISNQESCRKTKSERQDPHFRSRAPRLEVPVSSSLLFATPGTVLEQEEEELAVKMASGGNSQSMQSNDTVENTLRSGYGINGKLMSPEADSEAEVGFEVEVEARNKKQKKFIRNTSTKTEPQYEGSEIREVRVTEKVIKNRPKDLSQACNAFESKHKLARTDPRLQARLRSPFESQSPEVSFICPPIGDYDSDSDSDTNRPASPKINRGRPAAPPRDAFGLFKNRQKNPPSTNSTRRNTAGNSSVSKKSAAPRLLQADKYFTALDLDDVSATPSSPSTVKNDSDAENLSTPGNIKTALDVASSCSSTRSSKPANKAFLDPRTPSPQMGSRYIRTQREHPVNADVNPRMVVIKQEVLHSDMNDTPGGNRSKTTSREAAIKNEPETAPMKLNKYFRRQLKREDPVEEL